MNILQFKNATQHFMATNRVFRFYKKWTDNSGWLTFGCISIGVAVMIMLGVHNIPHLPSPARTWPGFVSLVDDCNR